MYVVYGRELSTILRFGRERHDLLVLIMVLFGLGWHITEPILRNVYLWME